jgi:hypothetical protein
MPALKKAVPKHNSFLRWSALLWVSGWAIAAVFSVFYAKELPLKQEASLRIAGILTEKNGLEQSYAAIKTLSNDQHDKLQQLNSRIQSMSTELKKAREKAAKVDFWEKTYRQELMRITTDYEVQLDSLRASLRTRDEIIAALRAQMQAVEQMIDQGSLAAVSGVASRTAHRDSLDRNVPASPRRDESLQGKVTLVNIRQRFFVVNAGADRGAGRGLRLRSIGMESFSVEE